ncbi:hypothetical protein Ga0074812_101333 [Parafrankia irregularis]|uniref:Uncharacterized protein n=1 Tax=Parafrankia irregularis TaxID=795642 RepID=A0A0S4QE35_9ACTN|nr:MULTISPECIES: hypothetical protein [Parafrankia]MBE3199501.1 hypothetical protein [Parafrankia sp. CH37]CUU53835.1 hypothetical protein Ga0074812_101333 [Parafrankia irregularis]
MAQSSWLRNDPTMQEELTSGIVTVEELLPPRTTEYRSGSVLALGFAEAEPATEPIRVPRIGPSADTV